MQEVRVRNLIPSNVVNLDEDITNIFLLRVIRSSSFLRNKIVPREANHPHFGHPMLEPGKQKTSLSG